MRHVTRRRWLNQTWLAGIGLAFGAVWTALAGEQATLEERLKFGLKCRRNVENEFVALVVTKINSGQIPEALVLQTMQWAIRRNPKFPFFYFQYAILKQAEALGVSL